MAYWAMARPSWRLPRGAHDQPGVARKRRALVAERDGRVLGFATADGRPPDGALGMLFVAADAIGQGIGRVLSEQALAAARQAGFVRLEIDADPHAEPFCPAMGAVRVGQTPSGSASAPGRMLPLLAVAPDREDRG